MKITAAFFLALMTMASSAQAITVSVRVGPLINEARDLANAKNYKAALTKLDEAEAMKSYPDDGTVINAMRKAIAIASSHQSSLQP